MIWDMVPELYRKEGMEICCECNGTGLLDKYKEICYHCKGLGKVDWIKNITDHERRERRPRFFYRKCFLIYRNIHNLFLSSIVYSGLSELGQSIGRLIEDQHPFFDTTLTYSKTTNEFFVSIYEKGSTTNMAFLCFSIESLPTAWNKNKQDSRGNEWKGQDMC